MDSDERKARKEDGVAAAKSGAKSPTLSYTPSLRDTRNIIKGNYGRWLYLKKLLTAICLALTVFLFAGCAEVQYASYQNPDGSIVEQVGIKVNSAELEKLGINRLALLTEIKQKFIDFRMDKTDAFVEHDATFTITPEVVTADTDAIIATLKFSGYFGYCGFWGIDPNAGREYDYEHGNFVTKEVIYSGISEFGGGLAGTFITHFTDYINLNKTDGEIDKSKIKLSYIYGTPDSKIRSDADRTFASNGVHFHLWDFAFNETASNITLFRYTFTRENRALWYAVAIGATVLIMGTVTLAWWIRRNKKPLN